MPLTTRFVCSISSIRTRALNHEQFCLLFLIAYVLFIHLYATHVFEQKKLEIYSKENYCTVGGIKGGPSDLGTKILQKYKKIINGCLFQAQNLKIT